MEHQGLQSNIEVVYRREDHTHPHVVLVLFLVFEVSYYSFDGL